MILPAFLLLFCTVFTWKVFPKKPETEGPHESSRGAEQAYDTLDQVKAALQVVGLESSNLIIGVDFTKSNEWTGKRCFDGRSLHNLDASSSPNPYERAIGIIGDRLSGFDEDNEIPCFGFGDMSMHDRDVFRFYGDGRACVGIPEVLQRYREIAAGVRLSGPTSLAPIIETAMGIVEDSGYQYHILLIIADGQVPRCSCAHCASNLEETRSENYIEESSGGRRIWVEIKNVAGARRQRLGVDERGEQCGCAGEPVGVGRRGGGAINSKGQRPLGRT